MNYDEYNSELTEFGVDESYILYNNQLIPVINSLKILGLSTIQANICVSLLHRGNLPISGLLCHSNGSKSKLIDSIEYLKSLNLISAYSDTTRHNRVVLYYQLEKTPREFYDFFNKKSSDTLDTLEDIYKRLCLGYDSSDKFNITTEYLYQIGIDKDYAKVLAALEFNCYEEVFGKEPVPNSEFRSLYQTGWVRTDRKKKMCLQKNVKEIAQQYINLKRTELSISLENLLTFVNIIENNKNRQIKCTECDDTLLTDKRRISHSKATRSYNQLFYESIKGIVISCSDLEKKPLELELKAPHPQKVRVYLYKTGFSKRHLSENNKEYKTVLCLPGQKYGDTGKLDFSGVTLVIVGGYCVDKKLFVFWDSHYHKEFAFNANLQVKAEALDEAEVLGVARYNRKLSNATEKVIIVKPEKLDEAISELYENYYNHLMEDDI